MAAKFNKLYKTKITSNNFLLAEAGKKKNCSNNRQPPFIGINKPFINDNQISILQNDVTQKMQR
jgi:hypothetical protein